MCAKIFALNISDIYWIISRIFEFCLKRNDSRKMKQLKKWMMKKKKRENTLGGHSLCAILQTLYAFILSYVKRFELLDTTKISYMLFFQRASNDIS